MADFDDGMMTCPRCLGKGYVDLDDIRRLSMEHQWSPGSCLYCNAQGRVERGKPNFSEVRAPVPGAGCLVLICVLGTGFCLTLSLLFA